MTSDARGGAAEVRTSAGTVTLETPLPLQKNSVLTLLVTARTPVFKLTVLSVDGTPAQVFARQAAQPAPGAPGQAALVTLSGSGAALTPGLSLTATLLTPGRVIPAPLGAPPANTPGAGHIGGHVRAFGLSGQTPGAGGAPAQTAAGPAGQAGFAAAGSAARVTVLSLTPPGPGAQPSPQAPFSGGAPFRPGLVLHGVVIGQSRAGHTVVQTQAGAVTLPSAALPLGAKISFTVDQAPEPAPGGVNAPSAGAARALLRSPGWPSFTDAMQALERADPALAQQVTAGVLPNPARPGGLAAGILMFLGALKTGDIRAVLGDAAMRAVERARPAAAARLDGDFRGLAQAADDAAPGGEWRVTAVPLALGHEIQPIRLLMRRRGGDDGEGAENPEDESAGDRFVVDVTLHRLGRVQIDGTLHEGGRRMDLIMRTERRLPGDMQNSVRRLFSDAGALTGLGGGMTFQAGPGAFVEFDGGGEPEPGAHVGVEA